MEYSPPKFKPNDLVRKKKQTQEFDNKVGVGCVCYVRNDEYEQNTNWKQTPPKYNYVIQFHNGAIESYVSEQTIDLYESPLKQSLDDHLVTQPQTQTSDDNIKRKQTKPQDIYKPLNQQQYHQVVYGTRSYSTSSLSSVSSFSEISTQNSRQNSSVIDSYEYHLQVPLDKKKKCFWNWSCCGGISVR